MNTLRDLFPILYADVCIMNGDNVRLTISYKLDISNALSEEYLDAEISRIECENDKVLIWLKSANEKGRETHEQ